MCYADYKKWEKRNNGRNRTEKLGKYQNTRKLRENTFTSTRDV